MGYPNDMLSTRAIIKHGKYALIPPQGRVKNVIPNLMNCNTSIIASPQLGTYFAMYTVEVLPGGGTTAPFQAEGIETFLFCMEGKTAVTVDGTGYELTQGGYIFAPASQAVGFENGAKEPARLLLYKQRYRPLAGYQDRLVIGNLNEMPEQPYDGMENVRVRDLLPSELGFDVNFHTLSFDPGGCHPFVETHVQEHGMYFLEGEALYLIDDTWLPVKKEDFVWLGPYVPQACYGVGRSAVTYIYTKDCNRDIEL